MDLKTNLEIYKALVVLKKAISDFEEQTGIKENLEIDSNKFVWEKAHYVYELFEYNKCLFNSTTPDDEPIAKRTIGGYFFSVDGIYIPVTELNECGEQDYLFIPLCSSKTLAT